MVMATVEVSLACDEGPLAKVVMDIGARLERAGVPTKRIL
jgi:hypothetical protein